MPEHGDLKVEVPARLKHCPFCGSCSAAIQSNMFDRHANPAKPDKDDLLPVAYWIQCAWCNVFGPTGSTQVEASERWNHRFRGGGEEDQP